jgi:hypothetical protein
MTKAKQSPLSEDGDDKKAYFLPASKYKKSPFRRLAAMPKKAEQEVNSGSVIFLYLWVSFSRRKIRLIEVNATCSHLKQLTCRGTSRQVLSEFINWR